MNYEFKPPKYSEIGKSLCYKWTMDINLLIDARWLTHVRKPIFCVFKNTPMVITKFPIHQQFAFYT